MAKLPAIFPHQLLMTENEIDLSKISQDGNDLLADFNEQHAAAEALETAGTLEDKTVSKLTTLSKAIAREFQDYLSEIERAQAAAAKAEQDKKDAAAKAEQDRIAAEQQQQQAEQDRIAAEQDRIAAEQKAEQDRIAAAEAEKKRKANEGVFDDFL